MNSKDLERLERTLKPYRSLIDIIQAGVNLIDRNGRIIYVNDAYCRMHHYTKEELLGKTIDKILPDTDPLEGLKTYRKIVSGEIDRPFTVESHNIRRDGTSFPVLIAWNYLIKDNEYDGMIAVVLDISKIKEVENALLESKRKYQSLVENISDLIWETDDKGNYTYVSPRSADIFGYEPSELIGRSILDLIPKDDKDFSGNLKEIILRNEPFSNLIMTREGKTGKKIVTSSNAVPVIDGSGKFEGYRGIDRDITMEEKVKEVRREMEELKAKMNKLEYLEYLMGDSRKIKEVHKAVEKVAGTDLSVLITGETGTGKEIIATSIHNMSGRKINSMVSIDCGSIPENLIESELFGYEKGAFTGAVGSKDGAFQTANGGSLFLDEITNLSLDMQKKLLRVLQEREVQKIGSMKKEKLNIRVISASNEDISDLVKKGKFRKDLYYRLNEFHIAIPSLRERKDDIPTLVQRLLEEISGELRCKPKTISKEAMDLIFGHNWPGNVRELKNSLKRAMVISDSELRPEHFDLANKKHIITDANDRDFEVDLADYDMLDFKKFVKERSARTEKELIEMVLKKFNGNKSKTSKFLNIDYKTILQKIHDYGL